MIRCLSAVGLCVSLAALAMAGSPYQPAYQTAGGVIAVPAYTAQYSPGDDEISQKLDRILEELAGLRAEVERLKSIPPGAVSQKVDAVPILVKSCLRCHNPDNAEGDFVLFADAEGKALAPLTPREINRIKARVRGNSMPPPPAKLSADDKAAIASHPF